MTNEAKTLDPAVEAKLHRDLVRLGDMMGDGMHLEPGGSWIAADYRRVARALGYGPKRSNTAEAINAAMAERLKVTPCPNCSGTLKQTRSGSKRAACSACQQRYQFKSAPKRKARA
jgi:hypothetical protein